MVSVHFITNLRMWSFSKIEKMNNGKFLDISGEDIKRDDVFDRLKRSDVNKAKGPDNVHPHVLKHCASIH
jgi:hypothetical protein